MKNSFFTLLASLTATSIFAQESATLPAPAPVAVSEFNQLSTPPAQQLVSPKQGFFYVRFTAGEHDMARATSPVPGLGLGYRRLAGDGTADISVSGIGISEHRKSRYFWTAPKASYYHYLQPNADKSFYLGGGLAWGGLGGRSEDSEGHTVRRDFVGIIPSATVGYEFAHKQSFLGFTEFSVSQPALAVSHKGSFPGPIAELSAGIGF